MCHKKEMLLLIKKFLKVPVFQQLDLKPFYILFIEDFA